MPNPQPQDRASSSRLLCTGLGVLALLSGVSVCVAFGLHQLVSVDLGYHLAYGRWMVEHHQVLSANQFSYTYPGYPFVNANWLFQILVHGVFAVGGATGLSVLLVGLIATLAGSLVLWMRLRGVGPALTGLAVAAVALTSYERFTLRPEQLSLLCLIWTLILIDQLESWRWRSLVGLAIVQVIWVNCHSYFLLAPILVGAHLIVRLAQAGLLKLRGRVDAELSRRLRWLALAVTIMIVCCLANPRGFNGATFPLRTLAYLRDTDAMTGAVGEPNGGPWSVIAEFGWSLNQAKIPLAMQTFYRFSLILGVLAVVVQLIRRRILDLPAMLVLLPASLVMRRNVPLWAVVAWPATALAVQWLVRWLAQRVFRRSTCMPGTVAAVATAVVLSAMCWNVLSDRFYVRERRDRRAGLGISALAYPAGGVNFLSDVQAVGHAYCQFEVGSYLLTFGQPLGPVFVHSNTFAYPPEFFGQTVQSQEDPDLFTKFVDQYDIRVVLLKHTHGRSHRLIASLSKSKDWVLVFFDHNSVVFVRNVPEYQGFIQSRRVDLTNVDLQVLSRAMTALDPAAPGWGMVFIGNLLNSLGAPDLARQSYQLAVSTQPDLYEAWNQLGVYWGGQAAAAAQRGDGFGQRQFNVKALECFQRAVALNPRYEFARENLRIARRNLGMP